MYFASSTGWMVDPKNKFRRIPMWVDQPNLATIDLSYQLQGPKSLRHGLADMNIMCRPGFQHNGSETRWQTPFFFFFKAADTLDVTSLNNQIVIGWKGWNYPDYPNLAQIGKKRDKKKLMHKLMQDICLIEII